MIARTIHKNETDAEEKGLGTGEVDTIGHDIMSANVETYKMKNPSKSGSYCPQAWGLENEQYHSV